MATINYFTCTSNEMRLAVVLQLGHMRPGVLASRFSSQYLLVELPSDQHPPDFLRPSTDSIQPGVSQVATGWVI